jgi:two-component system, response regulator
MTIAKPKRILLVEDNPDDVELTRIGLTKHHLVNRLVVARDGEEALDMLLGEHATTFAVVMLDIKLPKIDGLDVLARIRADPRTCNLPVVVLTSSSQQEDVVRSYSNGASSYVRKPVDFNEFSSAVADIGLYWAVLNEVPDTTRAALDLPVQLAQRS